MAEPLTVLIPCKNEWHNLRACVASVRAIADEVLVADSLSTDGTSDLAVRLGCRVIQREFIDFASFKNWAIPQARHPWVLVLDADERITPALAEEIRQVLTDPPEHLDGWFVPRLWYFMGHPIRYSGWQTDQLFRLFHRDRCRYKACRVHEEIDYDPRRAGCLKNQLDHFSYWSYDEFFAKHVAYTRWGAQDQWDRGQRTSFLHLFFKPLGRFLHLYFLRRGFLDGLPGLQVCMLTAFFNSFVKQARLWQMEHGLPRPEEPTDRLPLAG